MHAELVAVFVFAAAAAAAVVVVLFCKFTIILPYKPS